MLRYRELLDRDLLKRKRDRLNRNLRDRPRRLWLALWIGILLPNGVWGRPGTPYWDTSPPRSESAIPVTVEFVFNNHVGPIPEGNLVVGIYSETETYDVMTKLDLLDIRTDNPRITPPMWDNYYRLIIPLSEGEKGMRVEEVIKLDPLREYAITVFYDRNQNWEFNFLSYPREKWVFQFPEKNSLEKTQVRRDKVLPPRLSETQTGDRDAPLIRGLG